MMRKLGSMILSPTDDPLDENLSRKLKTAGNVGELLRVKRARYVKRSDWLASGPEQQHLFKMHAVDSAAHRRPPVFSKESAAILWGLPLGMVPDQVNVNVPKLSGHRSSGLVARRCFDPIESGHWNIDGLAVTGKLQTAVELALILPMTWAVAVMDRLLGEQRLPGEQSAAPVSKADVDVVLRRLGTVRAIRRASRVLDFADPNSGSPGESISRVNMHLAGLPPPELQTRHEDRDGLIGISDFAWKKHRLIGEFDGMSKYQDEKYLKGRGAAETIRAEKQREERLRQAGWTVTRWLWDTAISQSALREHLLRAGLPRE
ncbi:MAG: hypothetical protein IIZ13_10140 [Renibacterium sp.]|nr:hypothetical protein [Renibacterium sp.]